MSISLTLKFNTKKPAQEEEEIKIRINQSLMALDSWLIRVKSALSPTSPKLSTNRIGILAFEVAGIMSKLLHLWRSLSDNNLLLLHRDSISLPGIRKIVSDDDSFLLSLASAEFIEILRTIAVNITLVLSHRCIDRNLREFGFLLDEFAEKGSDEGRWVMTWREMEGKVRKMERLVAETGELYKEMDAVVEMEQSLRRLLQNSNVKLTAAADVRQKVAWKKTEVKRLKETSLWCWSFDAVTVILVRAVFTTLARIKQVIHFSASGSLPAPHLSISAAVHPSSDTPNSISVEDKHDAMHSSLNRQQKQLGFFKANSAGLVQPPSTLGSAALAVRYANIIVVIEKMIRFPRSIGPEARDDLYAMLPESLRSTLRSRLRTVARCPATDTKLANEWRMALAMIVDWLCPLAHNTLRWQSERSFERRGGLAAYSTKSTGVLMLQTLQFAETEKAEASVAELLVGLNYVWRFEMEMAFRARAKATAAAAVQIAPAPEK